MRASRHQISYSLTHVAAPAILVLLSLDTGSLKLGRRQSLVRRSACARMSEAFSRPAECRVPGVGLTQSDRRRDCDRKDSGRPRQYKCRTRRAIPLIIIAYLGLRLAHKNVCISESAGRSSTFGALRAVPGLLRRPINLPAGIGTRPAACIIKRMYACMSALLHVM